MRCGVIYNWKHSISMSRHVSYYVGPLSGIFLILFFDFGGSSFASVVSIELISASFCPLSLSLSLPACWPPACLIAYLCANWSTIDRKGCPVKTLYLNIILKGISFEWRVVSVRVLRVGSRVLSVMCVSMCNLSLKWEWWVWYSREAIVHMSNFICY